MKPDATPAPSSDSRPAQPGKTARADTAAGDPAIQHNAIRSFVVRAGRMTAGQDRAWLDHWPAYGIDPGTGVIDFAAVFGRRAPVTFEIGFGNGESLVALALAHPERNFVGLEVHRPGVGHLMLRCAAQNLTNVRVICQDAVEILQQYVADAALAEVLLYFPDPWPKKRHHKRRIVQPQFVDLVVRRLVPGGVLRMATDWQPYAEHMLAVAAQCAALRNESPDGGFVARPESRPLTRFEQRGQQLGHGVWDLAFRKA